MGRASRRKKLKKTIADNKRKTEAKPSVNQFSSIELKPSSKESPLGATSAKLNVFEDDKGLKASYIESRINKVSSETFEVKNLLRKELVGITPAEIELFKELELDLVITVIDRARCVFSQASEQLELKNFVVGLLTDEVRERQQWKSLKQEISRIKNNDSNGAFENARLSLFELILPLQQDDDAAINQAMIREAGEIIYQAKGMNGMYDPRLWSFIPRSCHRLIEMIWDGIGDWRA